MVIGEYVIWEVIERMGDSWVKEYVNYTAENHVTLED